MTDLLHSPTSSSSSSSSSQTHDPTFFHSVNQEPEETSRVTDYDNNKGDHQLSLLAFLLALFRKSFWASSNSAVAEETGMEIGWPTDVRHVAHDRFNGFLGLPDELEPQVPIRAPSARINADNNQEEHLRNQLNSGVIPDVIDVHCLAGLIKAWFRELPTGILDPLSPEQVMQCQSEDDFTALCRLLPPAETALLDWAVNLMADVVQHEHLNKMNSHNIAMVFAPNMTQMADPLNALTYAVQVMNFLKTLILKTLRERQSLAIQSPLDENRDQGPGLNPHAQQNVDENEDR